MTKSNKIEGNLVFRVLYFFVQILLICAVITFMPGLPPDAQFKNYKLDLQPYTKNDKLNNIEKLFEGTVKGPEDLAVYKNQIYTSTHGGYVQKISNGKLVPVIKFGKKCNGIHEEHICGRPLGLKFDSKGSLYVADAYYGLFKVNITTGESTKFVSMDEPIENMKPMIPNAVDVSQNGDVYWTDSSTEHKLYDGMYTMLENGNGRLLKFNAAKQKNEVLLKNLHFPNGLALSKDESFIVVSETFRGRLLKYYLKGPKAGNTEIFTALPGFPDNIHFDGSKFYVAIISVPDSVISKLSELPLLRKFVVRVAILVEMVLSSIETLFPSELLRKNIHLIGHFEMTTGILSPSSIVMVFTENGKLIDSLSSTNSITGGISAFITHGGYHYLGSPFNTYLGRIKA